MSSIEKMINRLIVENRDLKNENNILVNCIDCKDESIMDLYNELESCEQTLDEMAYKIADLEQYSTATMTIKPNVTFNFNLEGIDVDFNEDSDDLQECDCDLCN